MTVDERFEQLERKTQRLEKRNKRLTVALTLTVVAMAATGDKDGRFDTVMARDIWVMNDAGDIVISLDTDDDGNGVVYTKSAKGKDLVALSSTVEGEGMVTTYQPNGKRVVMLGATNNGGGVVVFNKTGEMIAEIKADEYGNGVVGAYNRKGKGKTLKPGP